jgi:hypothetical protein
MTTQTKQSLPAEQMPATGWVVPNLASPVGQCDDDANRALIPWWQCGADPDGLLNPKRKLVRPFDLRELGYGWTACRVPHFAVTLLLMHHADTQEPAGFTAMYFDKLGLALINHQSFAEILGVNQQAADDAGGRWPA